MRRKLYLLQAVALFMTMTTCLYCALFAAFSLCLKISFGGAAAILYILMSLTPYFMMRRKDEELSMTSYMKTHINEIITKD